MMTLLLFGVLLFALGGVVFYIVAIFISILITMVIVVSVVVRPNDGAEQGKSD
tara:strand:+ start:47534 stop:47692 length:159 start_codon:yes stop_codon:yes gene_type:complete